MKIAADLHIHTVSSGHAYSTIEEYVAQAKKIGLKGIAITDHGSAMPGAPHWYHFSNAMMIPEKINGIRVYRGIEANIIDDQGTIDLHDDDLAKLDIVLVAMHPRCGYDDQGEEKNTEVLLKTLNNPYVNMIAHPGNPKYPLNPEKVIAAAKQKGVIPEINNSSFTSRVGSWGKCLEFAREVKRQNWRVVLTTDSHISTMLGVFDKALELVKEAGLSDDQIVNTSLAKIEKYLLRK
ncbi:MAG: phosphatase [Candidatus Margulisbacteria bacterium]|nr:phosphatase [Candidatus Margulisiibacteriota bacterium]